MKQLFSASALLAMALVLLATTQVAHASVGWDRCNGSFPERYYAVGPPGAVAICRADTLAISYDPVMICPAYSAYYLDKTREENLLPGRKSFYEDPDLKSLGITQASYRSDAFNSSWNRGHLAPSHALSWTTDTKHATYTMANIAPQAAIFNQQPWNRLETSLISWVTTNDRSVHVITGVGYDDRKNVRRTYDNIAVPDYYWKVLCDIDSGKSAGWFGDNKEGKKAVEGPKKVRDIQDYYYGYNTGNSSSTKQDNRDLFPSACNIDSVDESFWAGISGPALAADEPSFFYNALKLKQAENEQN